VLGLRVGVEALPAHSLTRAEHKSRRVVDDRKLFDHMRHTLGEKA